MNYSRAVEGYSYPTPPRVSTASAGSATAGEDAVVATSTTAAVLDLSTVASVAYNAELSTPKPGYPGLTGKWITLFAETADLGIVFGPTAASVTSANAPSLTAHGTVNSAGVYTAAAGVCHRIPAGTERRYLLERNDLFLGFVGSTAGLLRVFQSAPSDL